jgi:alpha-beta hydrolase superfamily lysophospholipase
MEKISIKNRKGQKIVALIKMPQNPKGLAFIMHGLGGWKEQPHIETFADAFFEKGYTAVRFDTTNTFGESDGKYEDATVTNYYQDLEDVINWSKTQEWYKEPFCLAGHSLGGICVILYSEKHPEEIQGLAPISTVVSGKLSLKTPKYQDILKTWQETGWRIETSESVTGRIKKLPWSHMTDRLKYDVLLDAGKLTMSVLMIVGDKDDSTPYEHQKLFFEKLPNRKEIHVIKDAPHTFIRSKQLAEIKNIFLKWIENLS